MKSLNYVVQTGLGPLSHQKEVEYVLAGNMLCIYDDMAIDQIRGGLLE